MIHLDSLEIRSESPWIGLSSPRIHSDWSIFQIMLTRFVEIDSKSPWIDLWSLRIHSDSLEIRSESPWIGLFSNFYKQDS